MAEEAKTEFPETLTVKEEDNSSITQAMEVEAQIPTESDAAVNGAKREREEGGESENGGEKKQKVVEKSVEEQRLETQDVDGEKENGSGKEGPVTVGPKTFATSFEMFDFFFKLLHSWSTNVNVNKYEHMMLLDLLQKGHLEPERKIGDGIQAFQIRFHPQFKSRCFFLIRNDESVEDFSFRKCVNNILPLPESVQVKSDSNMASGGSNGGGGGRSGGRGGWRGRGRGRGRGKGDKPRF